MKRKISILIIMALLVVSIAGCSTDKNTGSSSTPSTDTGKDTPAASDFPKKDFQGTIMWSAGGINDTVSRAIAPHVEKELGKTIIFTNRPGAAGGIATQYVNEQADDGYNLLFGAENPQIAKVMGTSPLDYSDFIPINIFGTSVGVIFVKDDSPYNTVEELVDDILAKPGEFQMGTTGPGGLPFTMQSMMQSINGTEVQSVAFDGENGAATAVLGGHVDYSITTLGSCIELIKAGKLRALAVFHDEVVNEIPEVPLIVDIYPEYEDVMPWGPFYGVFVKNGTDEEKVEILTEAFNKAMESEEYRELLKQLASVPLGLSGQEARDYVDKYRSVTSWLMYDSGGTEHSPEEFDIPRP